MKKWLFALLFCSLCLGCTSAAPPNSLKITSEEMGADWPFTVKEGFVSCQKTDIGDALLFTSDGNTYSLNGTASTKNLAPEIRGSGLWASDPKIAGLKDIGAVFEKARSTCSP